MSRYPYLQSQPYDQGLANSVPAPSNQDRQAGYDVGILETGGYKPAAAPALSLMPAGAAAPKPPSPVNPFQEAEKTNYYDAPLSPINGRKRPWWKTKRGMIILSLVGIVLIGILCGIGAGVATAKKRQKDAARTQSPAEGNNSLPRATSSAAFVTTRLNNGNPTISDSQSTTRGRNSRPTSTRRNESTVTPGPIAIAPTTTIQPGFQVSPPNGDNNNNNGLMPAYCYAFPFIPECAPFLNGKAARNDS